MKRPAPKYGVWVDQGLSAAAVKPLRVKVRVLAIPQAGMGAWAFHGWQELLPEAVEILPVELPGRNSRMLEPKGQSLRELVKKLVDNVGDELASKPYVVLGHSLGAWMAYEVVHELELRGKPAPLALFVSGARAPQLHDARRHDADRTAPCLAALPGGEFWTHFERRYGKNPDLAPASVKEYIEPLLRADFRLLETFEPRRTERLKCRVVACGATGDNRFSAAQLDAWGEAAPVDGFETKWFDATFPAWSTPHRYLVDDPKPFVAWFGPKVEELLAAARAPKPAKPAAAALPPPLAPGVYFVANKRGALVREGIELASAPVGDLLPAGTKVTVVESRHVADGRPRARVSEPTEGWLSCHVVAKEVVG